jgi:hypothetical protein
MIALAAKTLTAFPAEFGIFRISNEAWIAVICITLGRSARMAFIWDSTLGGSDLQIRMRRQRGISSYA